MIQESFNSERRSPMLLLIVAASLSASICRADDQPARAQPAKLVFETDVLPVLRAQCTSCHNPTERKAELDLTTLAGVAQGSESGAVVELGKRGESLLYEMVAEGLMPPEGKPSLSSADREMLGRWIDEGAKSNVAGDLSHASTISQHDIVPMLQLRCTVCHGLRRQEAGLDLRTKAAMLKGGKSGPAIVPGNPADSLILKRIAAQEMPPRKNLIEAGVRPMDAAEIAALTRWIAQGASEVDISPDVATTKPDPLIQEADRQFWAFQPPARPPVPKVKQRGQVRNPIDAFLLARLEADGIGFSPEAERFTLIRRACFDLTGLPPTWEEVQTFVTDPSPDAYSRMIDRYLASRHYGERWGQVWLDLAGYADSEGKRSADPVRHHAWRYRDYVIRAFNADKPYDRFLMEQIAGDELADYEQAAEITPELMDNLVATGFLRMAPDGTGSDVVNTVAERMEVIADEINVLGSGVLGLTLKCAQCHSHKYDPIPQRDYYRLVATLKGAYDANDWMKPTVVAGQGKSKRFESRVLPYVSEVEQRNWRQETNRLDEQINKLRSALKSEQTQRVKKLVDSRLAKLPVELHDDLRKMLATPAKRRTEVQKYLAEKFAARLTIEAAALKKLDKQFSQLAGETDRKIKAIEAERPPEPRIRALWDRGEPSPTYVYRRGEPTNPGRLVGPGVPAVLTSAKTPFDVRPPWPGAKQTGRRLALARWLTDPEHPLTARVMVNRIWKHHFGAGIVATLDNFGQTGSRPTHPKLLDWLAREFVERGWSIKAMHRLILNSSVYRQVSLGSAKCETIDPENKLLWRMPLVRMDAEVLRDSLLAVAGRLDDRPFGSPDAVKVRPDGLVTSEPTPRGWRRAIYVLHRRKEMPTILETFDVPQMMPNCIERPESTVASQALYLSNNGMVDQLARSFADRVSREAGGGRPEQIERVYQLALSRMPREQERQLGEETLAALTHEWRNELAGGQNGEQRPANEIEKLARQRALENYCHTILNSAAFLYID